MWALTLISTLFLANVNCYPTTIDVTGANAADSYNLTVNYSCTEYDCNFCKTNYVMTGMYYAADIFIFMTCMKLPFTLESKYIDVPMSNYEAYCPNNYIAQAMNSSGAHCVKLPAANPTTACSNHSRVAEQGGDTTYMCGAGMFFAGGSPENFTCCGIKMPERNETGVIVKMSTCLEIDPFYTDCGASCWFGRMDSQHTISAIHTNGSDVQEVHCKESNVSLSLIQVNKFVLQLYPFLVCPPNHLMTALWSNSAADHHLKTIKCNLLVHDHQMTNCQMFDSESDVAGCDTDAGYFMAGAMLDATSAIKQVMCCKVMHK